MKLISLSNSHHKTIVDDEDYIWLNQFKWFLGGQPKHGHPQGYATSMIEMNGQRQLIKMDRLLLPRKKGFHVDHINRNKLDNRRSNLRYLTPSENVRNCGPHEDNKTGFKGVFKHSRLKDVWGARAMIEGKGHWLGNFRSKEAAAEAYANFVNSGKLDKPASLLVNGLWKNNTSGVRGVTKSGKNWMARRQVGTKTYYLGMYKTIKEAAKALEDFNAIKRCS